MKIYLSKNKIIQNTILILTVVLLSSFVILDKSSKISLILGGLTLLILIFSTLQNGFSKKVKIGKYHLFIGMFSLYCFLSSTWSVYPERAIEKGSTIFQILICMSILYNYYSKFYSTEKLLECISLSSTFISIYTVFSAGIYNTINGLLKGQRLEVSFTNINNVSFSVSVGCLVIFYNIVFRKKYKSLIFIIINIFIMAVSGSRTFLVSFVLGCFLVIIIKNMKNKRFGRSILRNIIFTILFFFVMKFILELPMFDMINSRIEGLIASFTGHGEMESSASIRKSMILLGWEQFKKTPFLGVGIGNSGPVVLTETRYNNSYLHNNFIELLACGGIVGFLMYYGIYIYVFYNFLKNWKYRTDSFIVCFGVAFCLFVIDCGHVSYYSKNIYFYFMVFFLGISELKKKKFILRKNTTENCINNKV